MSYTLPGLALDDIEDNSRRGGVVKEDVFLGQLEALVEAARLGNITRAAESLSLTQPALTARLTRLERELGTRLLIRDRRGARLTEAGRSFLPYAEQALSAIAEGQRALGKATRPSAGELALVATRLVSTYVLPPVVDRFHADFPEIHLMVRTVLSDDAVTLILNGEADFGLSRIVHHPDIDCLTLYEEDFLLVVGSSHPLADAHTIKLADLEHEVLVLSPRSLSYQQLVRALRQAGAGLPNTVDVDDSEVRKTMVAQGIGFSVLPRTSVGAELAQGTLVPLAVTDLPPLRRSFGLMRRRGAAENALIDAFVRAFKAQLGQTSERSKQNRRTPSDPLPHSPATIG
jgi:DNA-binding transcriptional LysR family regulator